MAADPLPQPPGVGVGVPPVRRRVLGQFVEPPVDEQDAGAVPPGREVGAFAEADAVLDQPPQQFGEAAPVRAVVPLVDLLQFAQQVDQAELAVLAADLLVGRPRSR